MTIVGKSSPAPGSTPWNSTSPVTRCRTDGWSQMSWLTSSVTTELSVTGLIGALFTKIWKAVAVTILRRTAKALNLNKNSLNCICSFYPSSCPYRVSCSSSYLEWIWTGSGWLRPVWPPHTCKAAAHPQVPRTAAWGSPSAGPGSRSPWRTERKRLCRNSCVGKRLLLRLTAFKPLLSPVHFLFYSYQLYDKNTDNIMFVVYIFAFRAQIWYLHGVMGDAGDISG